MKSRIVLPVLLFLLFSCAQNKKNPQNEIKSYKTELVELMDYFKIPGLQVLIEKDDKVVYEDYLGYSDLSSKTRIDSLTMLPIASLTKMFTGVLMMKLIETKQVSLDEPMNKYILNQDINDSILIKHVLSNTSQGEIGKKFYYISARFWWLTKVIEKASGRSFKDFMEEEIFKPLKLKNTHLLRDSIQVANNHLKLAQPYLFDGEIKKGYIEYGFASSAGIISTVRDLAVFNRALNNNTLISENSKKLMFSSFKEDLPYGYGIFSQKFQSTNLIWAYGQFDCYSGLFLKIPSKNISVIILANNKLMSDPARLIMGDASTSLFVMSFLKNFVFDFKDMQLFETTETLTQTKVSNSIFYREKLLAQALAEAYMARFNLESFEMSSKLLEKVFTKYPDYINYADVTLMHNFSILKNLANNWELGTFDKFDKETEIIGHSLLDDDPDNPYLHIYLGPYYDRKGEFEKAKFHYESILNAPNFSRFWYTSMAQNWINKNSTND